MIELLSVLLLLAVIVLVARTVYRTSVGERISTAFSQRFVYGIPWGTVTLTGLVIVVYGVLQGTGFGARDPVVIGFRSWSLTYGQGLVFSSFAHMSATHLLGNLPWLVVFGTLIEYVIGHYPDPGRSLPRNTSPVVRRVYDQGTEYTVRPIARISLFLTSVFLYGVISSIATPGATIGVSGVGFVFLGIAVVVTPVLSLIAVLAVYPASLLVQAVISPVVVTPGGVGMSEAGWITTSLQGHYIGFLTGVLVGVVLLTFYDLDSREHVITYIPPNGVIRRPWVTGFAVVVIGVAQSLYAFAVGGGDQYVMYQAAGFATVCLLAVTVVFLVHGEDTLLIPQIELTRKEAAAGVIICSLLAFTVIGVAYNVAPVVDDGIGTDDIDDDVEYVMVNDYTLLYGQEIPDAFQSAVSSPVIQSDEEVTVSGVVVISEQRGAWDHAVRSAELRGGQERIVRVGDVTWREEITISRNEWHVTGSGTTYTVTADSPELRESHDEIRGSDGILLYESDPVTSPNTVSGQKITIGPSDGEYEVEVVDQGDGSTESVLVPAAGDRTTVAGITIENRDNRLYAVTRDSQTHIATYRAP